MRESSIQNAIRLALSAIRGVTMFRQNVGQAWTGSRVDRLPGNRVLIHDARPFRAGLVKGSSDLIGWDSVVVTQDMVGKRVAIFSAVEVKGPRGKLTEDQANFLRVVKEAGGISGVARSTDEATKLFE